ncbi:unnamed protein product, partial [Meganyctiphanes norvegica]
MAALNRGSTHPSSHTSRSWMRKAVSDAARAARMSVCEELRSIHLYEGIILSLHYRVTLIILAVGFCAVSQHWYYAEDLICKKLSNIENPKPLDSTHQNICLSYPYIEEDGEERRYILHYRWIPWAFLLLAAVYYIPRIASHSFSNTISKQLKHLLANARGDAFDDPEAVEFKAAIEYMKENKGSHNGIYWKYIGLNFLALGVDVFTMFLLDLLLQGRFIHYGLSLAEHYNRNPEDFSDEISRTFPPFVRCKIERVHLVVSSDEITYGCHLTFMELYEKVFLLLWFWLVIMISITILYIIYLMSMIPYIIFRNHVPCREIKWGVTTVGDYYIRFRLKAHVSESKCKHLFAEDLVYKDNVYEEMLF